MSGFEGSFLGAADKISPAAIMECKICWTPYDPSEGDDYRQVEPGTPFIALPHDWSCPNCSAPKEQFMVLEDPGAISSEDAARIDGLTNRLVADFREIWHAKMRDVPLVNKMLSVEAIGFQKVDGCAIGVLISPWFMNLIVLPSEEEDWSNLVPGTKEIIDFPSGEYEFLHNVREITGGYKACSLFSPMTEFKTHAAAVAVAEAVMVALFDEDNRADTDRAVDIRIAREEELEPDAEAGIEVSTTPTRRGLITGSLVEDASPNA